MRRGVPTTAAVRTYIMTHGLMMLYGDYRRVPAVHLSPFTRRPCPDRPVDLFSEKSTDVSKMVDVTYIW